jgi:hypothetical protein
MIQPNKERILSLPMRRSGCVNGTSVLATHAFAELEQLAALMDEKKCESVLC